MELDVFLEVGAELVAVQVIAEGEALPGDQQLDLPPQGNGEERLQPI